MSYKIDNGDGTTTLFNDAGNQTIVPSGMPMLADIPEHPSVAQSDTSGVTVKTDTAEREAKRKKAAEELKKAQEAAAQAAKDAVAAGAGKDKSKDADFFNRVATQPQPTKIEEPKPTKQINNPALAAGGVYGLLKQYMDKAAEDHGEAELTAKDEAAFMKEAKTAWKKQQIAAKKPPAATGFDFNGQPTPELNMPAVETQTPQGPISDPRLSEQPIAAPRMGPQFGLPDRVEQQIASYESRQPANRAQSILGAAQQAAQIPEPGQPPILPQQIINANEAKSQAQDQRMAQQLQSAANTLVPAAQLPASPNPAAANFVGPPEPKAETPSQGALVGPPVEAVEPEDKSPYAQDFALIKRYERENKTRRDTQMKKIQQETDAVNQLSQNMANKEIDPGEFWWGPKHTAQVAQGMNEREAQIRKLTVEKDAELKRTAALRVKETGANAEYDAADKKTIQDYEIQKRKLETASDAAGDVDHKLYNGRTAEQWAGYGLINLGRIVSASLIAYAVGLRGGNPNAGMDMINRGIEENLARQKMELDRSNDAVKARVNSLGALRAQFGDDNRAEIAQRQLMLDSIKYRILDAAQQTNDKTKAAAIQNLADKIDLQKQQLQDKKETQAAQSVVPAVTWGLPKGVSPNPKAVQAVQEIASKYGEVNFLITDARAALMESLRKKTGVVNDLLDPYLQSKLANIADALGRLRSGGQVTGQEENSFKKILFGPVNMFGLGGSKVIVSIPSAIKALDSFGYQMQGGLNAKLRPYNATSDSFTPRDINPDDAAPTIHPQGTKG